MRTEIATFYFPQALGILPAGWKPISACTEEEGKGVRVICEHHYSQPEDRLIRGDAATHEGYLV